MNTEELQFIQDQIGYTFKNADLLQQAFVRRSYSEENGGENNEVLEFIGDKVLDLFVVKLLATQYGSMTGQSGDWNEFACQKTEAQLTEIKKLLVQKKTLATRIEALGLADYLIMGQGDIQRHANEEYSVKEDLFEAILGAIAIDSNWDMAALENAVEIMLAPDSILTDDSALDYVSLIEEWTSVRNNAIPLYYFDKCDYQSTWYSMFDGISQHLDFFNPLINTTKFHCLLKISNDLPVFRGFGRSQSEARRNVCKLAYEHLCRNNLWLSICDEIENPNKDDAINQLEILARRGYFSIPTYDFKERYDANGNPIWHCTCHISEETQSFCEASSSKKDAKKLAAYKMLLHMLNSRR